MLRTDYESYEVTCKCLFSFTLMRNKSLRLCAHGIHVTATGNNLFLLIYSEARRKLLRRFGIGLLWSLNIKIKQSQKQTNKRTSFVLCLE